MRTCSVMHGARLACCACCACVYACGACAVCVWALAERSEPLQPSITQARGSRFLLTDLSLVNRSVTPWLVVNLHRPIYTSSASGLSFTSVLKVAQDLRLALEDLFFLYQVLTTATGFCCACL